MPLRKRTRRIKSPWCTARAPFHTHTLAVRNPADSHPLYQQCAQPGEWKHGKLTSFGCLLNKDEHRNEHYLFYCNFCI